MKRSAFASRMSGERSISVGRKRRRQARSGLALRTRKARRHKRKAHRLPWITLRLARWPLLRLGSRRRSSASCGPREPLLVRAGTVRAQHRAPLATRLPPQPTPRSLPSWIAFDKPTRRSRSEGDWRRRWKRRGGDDHELCEQTTPTTRSGSSRRGQTSAMPHHFARMSDHSSLLQLQASQPLHQAILPHGAPARSAAVDRTPSLLIFVFIIIVVIVVVPIWCASHRGGRCRGMEVTRGHNTLRATIERRILCPGQRLIFILIIKPVVIRGRSCAASEDGAPDVEGGHSDHKQATNHAAHDDEHPRQAWRGAHRRRRL
mmetsp:Transcript_21115/g.68100  ORF Transcript_21115/g.68100 Transcript_21115/m.68100 type:complete len:318 (+) Transcript_21115:362-1315(+)